MMSPSLLRSLPAITAPLAVALLLSVIASGVGCKQTACIQWSEREGMCPNRKEVEPFFGTCTDIDSVVDDGAYSGNLCCYEVTKNRDNIDCAIDSSGSFAVGVGAGVGSGPRPIPNSCDNSGTCGDTETGCLRCALSGPCATARNNCTQNIKCQEVLKCLSACMPDGGMPDGGMSDGGMPDGGMSDGGMSDGGMSDGGMSDGGMSDAGMSDAGMSDAGTPADTCADACMKLTSVGTLLYETMISCAVCKQCPIDCSSRVASVCGGKDGGGGAGPSP